MCENFKPQFNKIHSLSFFEPRVGENTALSLISVYHSVVKMFYYLGIPYDKVQQRILYLQVMDYDRFSRNDPIGEICVSLHTADLTNNEPQWALLKECKGAVSVSVCVYFKVQLVLAMRNKFVTKYVTNT